MKSIKMLMVAALTILSVSVFSQDTSMHKSNMQKMKYSCPMHPEVTSNKPGKCSKCGMDMKATANTKMHKNYACPMHPEVTSDKPGKCSKCGMDMKATADTKMNKNYACPMHPEVTSDKPGKCSKCGMDMEPIKSKAKKS